METCEEVVFRPQEAKKIEEFKQTKSTIVVNKEILQDDFIVEQSSFKHVTHISWSDEHGLEISTNDKDFAELFRKVGESNNIKDEKDVREVIFDYVSEISRTQSIDNLNRLDSVQKSGEITDGCDMKISLPYNFQHVTHCSFDKNGGFSVKTSDKKLSWFYNKSKSNNAPVETDIS